MGALGEAPMGAKPRRGDRTVSISQIGHMQIIGWSWSDFALVDNHGRDAKKLAQKLHGDCLNWLVDLAISGELRADQWTQLTGTIRCKLIDPRKRKTTRALRRGPDQRMEELNNGRKGQNKTYATHAGAVDV